MNDNKVNALPALYSRIFEGISGCILLLSPKLTVLTASDNLLNRIGRKRTDVIGLDLFQLLKSEGDDQYDQGNLLLNSLNHAIHTKKENKIVFDGLKKPNSFYGKVFSADNIQVSHKPIFDENGDIDFILQEIDENASQSPMPEQSMPTGVEDLAHQMEMLFHAVPAQVAIVSGPELTYSYINPQYKRELFPERNVLGLPLLEALPEIKGEPIWDILNTVYQTGQPYIDNEICVPLAHENGGELQDHYFNVAYQPLRDNNGVVNGILSFKYEVTTHVEARHALEARKGELRKLHIELQQAYEELQASNEELTSGIEELEAINEELKQAQDELAALNESLEERIELRTFALQKSDEDQQALNEELTSINEELSATNEELVDNQRALQTAVERLNISEQKIRSLIESAPFPIGVYTGQEMRIEMLNQAIIDTWGRGSDLIGKTYAEVLPELAGTGVYETLDKVYKTGERYEARNQRVDLKMDGQLKPFYFNYDFIPLFDEQDGVYGVMNTAADVTDLVNARLEAELNRKTLYNIIMASPVSKCILLDEGYRVYVANDRMLKLLGMDRELIMNRPLLEMLPTDQMPIFKDRLKAVYSEGITYRANELAMTLWRNEKMEKVYLDLVFQPYRDPHENIAGVIITAIDVTSQVIAREEVQQLNEELAATNEELKSANDIQAAINEELNAANESLKISQDEVQLAINAAGLATFDLNPVTGKFGSNDLTKHWFGLQPEDEIDLNFALAAIHEADRESVTEAISLALNYESGGNYDTYYRIVNPLNGVTRIVRAKGKTLFNNNREAVRLSGVLLDVTEQKKDEERKSDFIGMVSHELKTPLTSLKALIQVSTLKVRKLEDQFLVNALEKSGLQIRKMESMIGGFLNISRLESGKLTIEATEFDIQKLVDHVIKETELTNSTHKIIYHACAPVIVEADANKIESVVSNLISNAIKYSPKHTPIVVSCERSNDHVKISIKDEGLGITDADQKKIFDRYFRVESVHARHIAGFGIGLYLSAEIIYRHGGKIGVESTEGAGSTFYFVLPTSR